MAEIKDELYMILGRIEGQVGAIVSQQSHMLSRIDSVEVKFNERVDASEKRTSDAIEKLDTRTKSLEGAKAWLVGTSTAIAAVAAVLLQQLADLVFRKM